MKKLTISVSVLSVGRIHEFIIPSKMKVEKVVDLMESILKDEYGIVRRSSKLMLIDTKDNTVLNRGYSLEEQEIVNGSRLILI